MCVVRMYLDIFFRVLVIGSQPNEWIKSMPKYQWYFKVLDPVNLTLIWLDIYLFILNTDGFTGEVWERISNFIPYFTMHVIIYLYKI